jgi:hypothetical protein
VTHQTIWAEIFAKLVSGLRDVGFCTNYYRDSGVRFVPDLLESFGLKLQHHIRGTSIVHTQHEFAPTFESGSPSPTCRYIQPCAKTRLCRRRLRQDQALSCTSSPGMPSLVMRRLPQMRTLRASENPSAGFLLTLFVYRPSTSPPMCTFPTSEKAH